MSSRPKTPGKPTDLPDGFHAAPTPFDEFEPLGDNEFVVAAEHALTWMRRNGYRCQSVIVGKEGVQIIGLVDEFPHKQAQPAATPQAPTFGFPRPSRS